MNIAVIVYNQNYFFIFTLMQGIQIKTFVPQDHKIKALIYGPAGSGKTMFAGTAEKAVFASAEGGLLTIADKHPSFVDIKSLKDLMALYNHLKDEDHEYETVVIDSITEINEIIKLEIEKRTGHALQLQDWGEIAQKMASILRNFRDLPMNVLFIAQEQYINDEQKIKKIVPELNGKSATAIARFMDIVGYIHIEADGSRWIETSTNKNLLTKDRTQKIGDDHSMNFTEWQIKAQQIKVGKQTIKAEISTPEPQQEQKLSSGKTHLSALQKELKRRGAMSKAEALNILNSSLGIHTGTLDFSEDEASKMLIQLLQTPEVAHKEIPTEEITVQEEKEVDSQQTSKSPYSDPAEVKKFLGNLKTVREVEGLMTEVKNAFNEGEMENSNYSKLTDMCMDRMAEINTGLVEKPKKKAGRPTKSIA